MYSVAAAERFSRSLFELAEKEGLRVVPSKRRWRWWLGLPKTEATYTNLRLLIWHPRLKLGRLYVEIRGVARGEPLLESNRLEILVGHCAALLKVQDASLRLGVRLPPQKLPSMSMGVWSGLR